MSPTKEPKKRWPQTKTNSLHGKQSFLREEAHEHFVTIKHPSDMLRRLLVTRLVTFSLTTSFQSTQACSYLDNCILSENRHVKVWNFESSKRSLDASVPAATVTISTSSDTSSMTHNDNNSGGQDTAAVSLAYTRSSKVAQLQLQEALAAMKNAEMRSRQRSSPTTITLPSTTPSQETRHRRNKSSHHKPVSSKLSLGIKSPIRFHRKRPSF